jgi:hypothetical protein
MGRGIDYGRGLANVDRDTGIRFGVIPANTLGQSWYDASESDYGEPTCPTCGKEDLIDSDADGAPEAAEKDWFCLQCDESLWSDETGPELPIAHVLDDGEYQATQGGEDCDVFVLKSPYFTRAEYCSPCAPGACYLTSPCEDGDRAYCFGHDWFEDGIAPYPVYFVETGERVEP